MGVFVLFFLLDVMVIKTKHDKIDKRRSERRPLGKSSLDKLTDNIAKWIAKDCRPLSIVEDKGFADVLKVASQDASYKPPARSTITIRIHELYETEKKKKEEALVHTMRGSDRRPLDIIE